MEAWSPMLSRCTKKKLKNKNRAFRCSGKSQTRLKRSGRLAFSPLAILPMFTSDTFLTPRSMPL